MSGPLPEPGDRLGTRLLYGVGAGAFGIKDNGLNYLLLIFYNQVLGLPAGQVGAALAIALFVDAFTDPLIGHGSDRTRSRLGRRHPWMYAAILPTILGFWALWNPPEGADAATLHLWLIATAIWVRVFAGMFEIPNAAMAAELSSSYHRRTGLLSWRYFFGWLFGLIAGGLAFSVFLQPGADGEAGILNRAGYARYGLAAAAAIGLIMLVSALGTQRAMARDPGPRPVPLRPRWTQLRMALSNRSFLVILVAGMLSAMAAGLGTALNTYLQSYFWELSTDQISVLVAAAFLGVVGAVVLAGAVSRRLGKRRAALTLLLVAIAWNPLVILLRLAGLMPPNGDAALLPILFGHTVGQVAFGIGAAILVTSMLTDTIDANELAIGERTDGLYFASNAFVQKCVSGIGVFGSGLLLSAVAFPDGAQPGAVAADVLADLGLGYAAIVTGLLLGAAATLSRYGISEAGHGETIASLQARRAAGRTEA